LALNYLFKKNLLGNLLQSRYRTFVYVRKHIVHCLVFKEHFLLVAVSVSQLLYNNPISNKCQHFF